MLLEEESLESSPAQSARVFITMRAWAERWDLRFFGT